MATVIVGAVVAAAGVAGALNGPDQPPEYGVPTATRIAAWCGDRDAFHDAIRADLPALDAGSSVAGADVAAFLARHDAVVFAYEENAVPEAGAGPAAQVAWMREVAADPRAHDVAPFVEAETSVLSWATTSC